MRERIKRWWLGIPVWYQDVEASPETFEKGLELYMDGIVNLTYGGFRQNRPIRSYVRYQDLERGWITHEIQLNGDQPVCDCTAGQYGRICKHLVATMLYMAVTPEWAYSADGYRAYLRAGPRRRMR